MLMVLACTHSTFGKFADQSSIHQFHLAPLDRQTGTQLKCVAVWQGKSTLANYLLGRERSITGPEPGLTRDAVHGRLQFGDRAIHLVDTAGWMRRNRLHNYDESG